MEAEIDAYRVRKDRIASLLALLGLWPEDSRYNKRIYLVVLALAALNDVGFVFVVWDFSAANYYQKTNASIFRIDYVHSLLSIVVQRSGMKSVGEQSTSARRMDELVRVYYRDHKRVIVAILLMGGMWPDDALLSRPWRYVLAACSLAVLGLMILGVVNYMVQNVDSIMSLVSVISLILTFSTAYMKMLSMLLLQCDVRRLNGSLSALFESDLQVPEYRVHLLAYYPTFYRFFKVFTWYCVGFIVFSTSLPLVAALHGNYVRTYAIRVPFDYTPGGPLHWLIFAFEVMVGLYLGVASTGTDTAFGLYTVQMVGELHLLSHRFRSLAPGADYRRELKDCVDRHCLLVDSKHLIERLFGFLSATIALSCVICICSIIYQLTQAKNVPLFKLIIAIDYIVIKFLQAYTYAWFGNAITVESERCVESVYFSRWFKSGDVKLMKDVVIIRSQSPMYINALGFMMVQLDMFIKIVHASISYFFMLKTIEEKGAFTD